MSNFPKIFLNRLSSWLLWTRRVLRAVDDNCPVTLLTVVGASLTKAVVLNPPLAVDEHTHFEPPLVTHSWHFLSPPKNV